ncbi:MAG: thioredoxin domain-containing protein [Bacteroidales bacterium]|nr:thioredoxin domain-containing protein [Bacteroidales bacterium]
MKKNLLLLLGISLFFSACGQNKGKTEAAVADNVAENKQSEYLYVSPTQAEDTPILEEDLSGKVISLTSSEFQEKITEIYNEKGLSYKGRTPCMVDFYANWCRPCMMLKPATERLAEKYKGKFIIYKIDVDKAQDVSQALGIKNIPTLIFFKPNEQPRAMVGAPSEQELDQTIQEFIK